MCGYGRMIRLRARQKRSCSGARFMLCELVAPRCYGSVCNLFVSFRGHHHGSTSLQPTMLSKRKSLNDDLIIWHGVTKQNISSAVRTGLPFAVRRHKFWLDIVQAEVQKKSKSIVAQNFAFSTRSNSHPSQSLVSVSGDPSKPEEDTSFVHVELEIRVNEIVEALAQNLPVRVDKYNAHVIGYMAKTIATEMKNNAEASKILSFILYREQIASNRRPCIPTGAEASAIYRDVLEACINHRTPSIYKHLVSLDVNRDILWALFDVGISDLLPLVLRVRIIDLVLIQGCVVLVSVMLTYIVWRQEAFLHATTATDFVRLARDEPKVWIKGDELETFWSRIIETHTNSFLATYVQMVSLMRLKTITLARNRHTIDMPVLRQFQHEIFTHRKYSWIGFDVDHTLVEYRLPYLLKSSFEAAAKDLQQSFIGLRTLPPPTWQPELAQRGVAIDTNRGNFLHIAEDGTIQRAYHGSHEVSYFSINLLYSSFTRHSISASSASNQIIYMHTAADLIFAPLYAWIVDAFDAGAIAMEELGASLYIVPDTEGDHTPLDNPNDPFLANRVAYISLSSVVLKAARAYYANGFWKTICTTPDLLIQPNIEIREVLESLKDDNRKQLFVLTNGSWTHCNEVMKFAVGKDWWTFFDVVFTDAKKEIFFDDLNDLPFSEVDPENPMRGQKKTVVKLEKGKIYSGGNIHKLSKFFEEEKGDLTDVELPPRICYFGDHLMQDIILPAQHTKMWDMVAIIKEITNLYQPIEKDAASASALAFFLPSSWLGGHWLQWLFTQEAPHVPPDLYSPFFFLGRTGAASYFGKKVLTCASLCLHSIAKLARHRSVLKLSHIQQGMSRYSTSSDIKSLSKRVSAKVRAMTKEIKAGGVHAQAQRRASIRSELFK